MCVCALAFSLMKVTSMIKLGTDEINRGFVAFGEGRLVESFQTESNGER